MLTRLTKRGGKNILLCWNRGLGDIALGLYAMVHRIQEKIPNAKITFLIRPNLQEGFSLLQGVNVLVAPNWKRGEKVFPKKTLQELGVDFKQFDLIIEKPNPTDWVRSQRGTLVPKLEWNQAYDSLWKSFSLDEESIYIGIQPVAETEYGLWRNWPPERWMELVDLLGQLNNVKVLLFGFGRAPHFPQSHVVDLRGKTNLFELLSIVKHRCRAVVLPDSGILSMIYYLNTSFPIQVLSLWGDFNHGILKQNVSSPNSELRHVPLMGEHRDLSALSAKKVLTHLFPLKPLQMAPRAESAQEDVQKVGVILLAGGEGSRLGKGLKGLFPILGKSLFQIICEKVPSGVPIAIMTSPLNHAATVSFFGKNAFFGKEVYFFQQTMLPLLDKKKKETFIFSPDGNGSLFRSFAASSVSQLFEKKGIEIVSVVPIENPLADPLDPYLISHLRKTNADVVVKCIEEKEADVTMGALFERERGGIEIVEYIELGTQITPFYRYTGMSAFRYSFFQKASTFSLPDHLVWKKREKNFYWKREKLLFDVFPFAKRVEALLYPRHQIYAPLKEMKNLPQILESLISLET